MRQLKLSHRLKLIVVPLTSPSIILSLINSFLFVIVVVVALLSFFRKTIESCVKQIK
jgi:hypothetical protein